MVILLALLGGNVTAANAAGATAPNTSKSAEAGQVAGAVAQGQRGISTDGGSSEIDDANAISALVSAAVESDDLILVPIVTNSQVIAAPPGGGTEVALQVEPGSIDLTDTESNTSISVAFPPEAAVGAAVVADDGTVVYGAQGSSSADVAVHLIEDGSVRVQTVLSSPDAPHEFTYALEVPEGTVLTVEEDGSVIGLDAEGNFIVGARAPWAKDSAGQQVPTSYRVEGSSIIQTVTELDSELYPIVADPWLFIDLIEKVVWASDLWQYSPTAKVYPTWYGRHSPIAAKWAAWSEALQKTPRAGWPNPDTASMQDQFYCHWDFVRIRQPNKEYWGLDSKLPNRGYWGFVNNGCN